MEDNLWIIVLTGIAVLVVASIAISRALERRRSNALQNWANANGWAFAARDPGIAGQFAIPSQRITERRTFQNVLTGSFLNYSVTTCEISYIVGSGKHQSTHYVTVVKVDLPMDVPTVSMFPQSVWNKIGTALNIKQSHIQLGVPEFDKTWRTYCWSEEFAHDLIDQGMMQRMMSTDVLGREVFFVGSSLVVVNNGREDPTSLEQRVATACSVAGSIPAIIWHKLRG